MYTYRAKEERVSWNRGEWFGQGEGGFDSHLGCGAVGSQWQMEISAREGSPSYIVAVS